MKNRKRVSRSLMTAVSLALMAAVMLTGATAAAAGYDYTVTVSGGLYGEVSGSESETMSYGETWNPNDHTVTVTNDKYYFQGWHISGQEDLVGATTVDRDLDFVATFGIKGDVVAYTVQYLDANGAELAPEATFYGNVGDKPVVAFVYVEGYEPQAYNLTKTLSENAADNVFTFNYNEVEVVTEEETTGGGGTGGVGGTGGTGEERTGEETEPENSGTVIPENPTPGGPADVIDLDDNEAPKTPGGNGGTEGTGGNGGTGEKTEKKGLSKGAAIGIAAGGAAVLIGAGVVIALLVARRRRED